MKLGDAITVLTCPLGSRDEGLSGGADLKYGGRLDIVPLLEREGVHTT